jgi:acetate kinase
VLTVEIPDVRTAVEVLIDMGEHVVVINGGSSSIKFALFARDGMARLWGGKIDRIGLPGATLTLTDGEGKEDVLTVEIPDVRTAVEVLIAVLTDRVDVAKVEAIGHRFVHGMDIAEHAPITNQLLARIRSYADIDPEHLPMQLAIVDACKAAFPALMQVACFDTVFHHDMPRVAQLLPLPRRYEAKGVRRYGFHGLSCAYLIEELRRIDPKHADGKVIILHLGSGASVTAVSGGKSIDTSMGFTPAGGIPMSSRAGDLDPGALSYIMREDDLTPLALEHLINYGSGLLGVSETTADMYDLLQIEATDIRAKEAIDLFCYEAKKRIGAYTAALGGVDTIIFSGGIGAVAPGIRARICGGLEAFGVIIEESKNQANESLISSTLAPVYVRVMHTDEERMIAQLTGAINRS